MFSGCRYKLTDTVGIEMAGDRLSLGQFWCYLFVLPDMCHDADMGRKLVGGRVKG